MTSATSGTTESDVGVSLIAEQVQTTHRERMRKEHYLNLLNDLRKSFDEQNAPTIDALMEANKAVVAAESALRALVLDHYTRTGEKNPVAGVEVKLKSGMKYTMEAALEWAKRTGLALLPESLDEKAFAKIASVQPLPFVEKTETPQAQIDRDLSAVVAA